MSVSIVVQFGGCTDAVKGGSMVSCMKRILEPFVHSRAFVQRLLNCNALFGAVTWLAYVTGAGRSLTLPMNSPSIEHPRARQGKQLVHRRCGKW